MSLMATQAKIVAMTNAMKIQSAILKPNISYSSPVTFLRQASDSSWAGSS